METKKPKLRYFIYARKSSESEDRQVQSIDDQIERLKKLASDYNLIVKKIYIEAKSAKKPDNRPLFTEMLSRIENGEAEGILCWQINRLTRNPVDSGTISWMLQRDILKSIRTIDREYLPEDNVLMFNVETGTANQFIIDLKKSVKRGIDSKLAKGWLPSRSPEGYLNTIHEIRGENYIIKDPERFSLIRKVWDLMLTGNYTPPQVLDKLNNKWGYRTRKSKRLGGKELSRSAIYRILSNPFYAGVVRFKGVDYAGKHEPMITLEEFDKIQVLLGRKGKPRPKTHRFPFTGIIRCGECGCLITAETKTKLIKGTGKLKSYTYYHCTNRKKDYRCSQRAVVKANDLEEQIEKEINKFTILPALRDLALEILNERNDREIEDRTKIYQMQQRTVNSTQQQLDNLTKMRYRDLIDDAVFIQERNSLQKQIIQIKEKLRGTEARAERWLELTEKTFNFATYAHQKFAAGSIEIKKEILQTLGQNFLIKDKMLFIEAASWLQPIIKAYPQVEKEYLALELKKSLVNKGETAALTAVRTRLRRGWDSNPRDP